MSSKVAENVTHTTIVSDEDVSPEEVFWRLANITALVMLIMVIFVVCLCHFIANVAPAFDRYTQSVYLANYEFAWYFIALLCGIASMIMAVRVIMTYFSDED
jgi:succinate dehydrogenase hydrophobic anchor subunit